MIRCVSSCYLGRLVPEKGLSSSKKLVEQYDARVIKTRDLIRKQLPRVKEERGALQRAGEKLDKADRRRVG